MNEEKFTGKADVYNKFRPTYPSEFIDYLYSEVGFNVDSKIADIGAGTGILSKLLLLRNSNVICVEPNIDMLNVAKRDLIEFPNCSFVKAPAEDTSLDENSIDFITVAQAFHWFDHDKFKIECRRILKSEGKLVLIWNTWSKSDELVVEIGKVNQQLCPNFKGDFGGNHSNLESCENFFKGGICDFKVFKNYLSFNEQEFIGSNLSLSFAPKENSENYNEYIIELRKLFDKYGKDGIIVIPNVTRSYAGEI